MDQFNFVENRLSANVCNIFGIGLGLNKNKSKTTGNETTSNLVNTDLTQNTNQSQTTKGTTSTTGTQDTTNTTSSTDRQSGSVTGQTFQTGIRRDSGVVSNFSADQQRQLDSLIAQLSGSSGDAAALGLDALRAQIDKVGSFDPLAVVEGVRAGAAQNFADNIAPQLSVFAQDVGGTGATNGVAALVNQRAIGEQEARVAGATADALMQGAQTQQSGLAALGDAVTKAVAGITGLFGTAKGGTTTTTGTTEEQQSGQSAQQQDLLSALNSVAQGKTITTESMMQLLQEILSGTTTERGTQTQSGTTQTEGTVKGKSMGASLGFKL